MKIAIKVKIKNGVLQEFIERKGWSQRRFARKIGVTATTAGLWFNLKGYPKKKEIIRKVCRVVKETEDVIFPGSVKTKDFLDLGKEITYYKEVDSSYYLKGGMELLEAPEEESLYASEKIDEVLETLPYRLREILINRYGLNCKEKTLKELAERFFISTEWVRQLERKAIRMMQHPARSMVLEKID